MTGVQDFETIVREQASMIARIASTYERRPALIEELTQDVFLALYRALPGFRGDASLRTFIARITHNVCVDHVRRATRRPQEHGNDGLDDLVDSEQNIEAATDLSLARDRLLTAVRTLPLPQRQLISLHLEGFDNRDIAEALGMSAGNVRVRLHRAKEILKTKMEASR